MHGSAETSNLVGIFQLINGPIEPRILLNPFFFYLCFPVIITPILIHTLFTWTTDPVLIKEMIVQYFPELLLTGRIWTAFIASLMPVFIFYLINKFMKQKFAFLGGIIASLAWVSVAYSKFFRYDPALVTFMILCFVLVTRLAKKTPEKIPLYEWGILGLSIGATASIKSNGLAVLGPACLILVFHKGHLKTIKSFCFMFGILSMSYLTFHVPAFLQWADLLGYFNEIQSAPMKAGWDSVPATPPHRLLYDAVYSLPVMLGWEGLGLAVVGLFGGLYLKKYRTLTILTGYGLFSFWLPMGILAKRTRIRDLLPVTPFIIIFIVIGLRVAISLLNDHKIRKIVFIGLSCLLVLTFSWRIVQQKWLLSHTKTQIKARKWIEKKLDSGTSILTARAGPDILPTTISLDRMSESLGSNRLKIMRKLENKGKLFPSHRPKYNISINPAYGRPIPSLSNLKKTIKQNNIRYIITSSSSYARAFLGPGVQYHRPAMYKANRRYFNWIETHSTLIRTFVPMLYHQPGSLIKIYRVNRPLDSEVKKQIFDPFPGMDPPDGDYGYFRTYIRRFY